MFKAHFTQIKKQAKQSHHCFGGRQQSLMIQFEEAPFNCKVRLTKLSYSLLDKPASLQSEDTCFHIQKKLFLVQLY